MSYEAIYKVAIFEEDTDRLDTLYTMGVMGKLPIMFLARHIISRGSVKLTSWIFSHNVGDLFKNIVVEHIKRKKIDMSGSVNSAENSDLDEMYKIMTKYVDNT